jgi:NADH-quinone oxidoreductase subunit H
MIWLLLVIVYLFAVYLLSIVEKRVTYKKWNFTAPFACVAFLLVQEDVKPHQRDKVFYETAPILFIAAALLAVGVLPFARGFMITGLSTGALFINAAFAYIMVAMVMAGWAPNGVYAMIAGWRFLAQLIAYSMPIVMAITATVMRAQSMSMTDIIQSQAHIWNIIYQPVGFVLFYIASMALAFLPPFDLPLAPGELAEGVWAEFTGARLLIFRLGRLMLILSLSLAVTVLFLGGWEGPWLPGFVWTFIKTLVVATSFFLFGQLVPRLQQDDMLAWSWKLLTPAALFNILWVGILLLL